MLVPILEELFCSRSASDWQQRLETAEVPHAPVWNYAQLFADPQAVARGLKCTVRDPQGQIVDLTGSPFHIAGADLPKPTMPPRLGEHSDEVLGSLLGMDWAKIQELRGKGIVA